MYKLFVRAVMLLLVLGLIFGGLGLQPGFVRAQAGDRIVLSPLDISQFPLIKFNLEMYDERGNFIADLQQEQIKVLEDGVERPLTSFERQEPGIQLILAYNPSSSFAQPAPGGNYLSYVQKTLLIWAQNQIADQKNTLSVTNANGLYAVQIANAGEWPQIVQSYQPDLMNSQPNLISLSVALDLATDPVVKPNMKSVIFYITSILPPNMVEALPNQLARAVQAGVPVFVWLVAPGQADSPEAEPLHRLASETGGSLYVVSTSEEVPGLDGFIQPMRYLYQASYQSQIAQSGTHHVSVEVERQGVKLQADAPSFNMNLQPPTPIFLSPPTTIERKLVAGEDKKKVWTPDKVTIQYLLEFPDKKPRELREARLYMDGLMVAQNNQSPFNQFELSLEGLESEQTINLQVEVIDTLGLSQRSIQIPVQVVIPEETNGFFSGTGWVSKLILPLVVLLVAAGLVFILVRLRSRRLPSMPWTRGAIKQGSLNRNPAQRMGSKPIRALARNQTITLPRSAAERAAAPRAGVERVTSPRLVEEKRAAATQPRDSQPVPVAETKALPLTKARLVPLDDEGNALLENAKELTRAEMVIGNDMKKVHLYIDSPGLNASHARLRCLEDGTWQVFDGNTIAGTYVNFNPVDSSGKGLRHGDLVQFGTVSYRFELANPTDAPRPVVSSQPPNGDVPGTEPDSE